MEQGVRLHRGGREHHSADMGEPGRAGSSCRAQHEPLCVCGPSSPSCLWGRCHWRGVFTPSVFALTWVSMAVPQQPWETRG